MKFVVAFLLCASLAVADGRDLAQEIPNIFAVHSHFDFVPNVAQAGDADWNNVICVARDIALWRALDIADKDPNITYFFYVKGNKVKLDTGNGDYRLFQHCDAVFFSGKPQWESTSKLADGYVRKNME